jgi:hypothetical protein
VRVALLSSFFAGSENVGGIDVSHLLFVDDNLIFCGAYLEYLCNLHYLFLCFESISGFKINLTKLFF